MVRFQPRRFRGLETTLCSTKTQFLLTGDNYARPGRTLSHHPALQRDAICRGALELEVSRGTTAVDMALAHYRRTSGQTPARRGGERDISHNFQSALFPD